VRIDQPIWMFVRSAALLTTTCRRNRSRAPENGLRISRTGAARSPGSAGEAASVMHIGLEFPAALFEPFAHHMEIVAVRIGLLCPMARGCQAPKHRILG